MPVEIKELVIRAVAQGDALPGGNDANKGRSEDRAETRRSASRDEIIEAAVKEVLRILRASRER